MAEKTILILGGAIGGQVVANRLRRLLGRRRRGAFASGNFYATPEPSVKMRRPGPRWHWGKLLLERWWLRHWF